MREKILKFFLTPKVRHLLIIFLIKLQNFSYKLINSLVVYNNIHPKHKLIKYYLFFINNVKSSDNVLDIGCGAGFLTFKIAEKAKRVVAIEINKKVLDYAKKNFNRNNIEYIHSDATKYNFEEKFDVVIMSNILEHLNNRTEFLQRVKELADKFLIRVPMIDRDWLTLYKKSLGLEYRLDKNHFIEYTYNLFMKELGSVGLKIDNHIIKFGEIWAVVSKSKK